MRATSSLDCYISKNRPPKIRTIARKTRLRCGLDPGGSSCHNSSHHSLQLDPHLTVGVGENFAKRPLKVSLSPQMTVSPYPENTLPKQALRICEWSISYRFGRQIPHLTLQKRKVGQLLKWATAGVGSFCLEVLTSYFSNINVTGACWLNNSLFKNVCEVILKSLPTPLVILIQ